MQIASKKELKEVALQYLHAFWQFVNQQNTTQSQYFDTQNVKIMQNL